MRKLSAACHRIATLLLVLLGTQSAFAQDAYEPDNTSASATSITAGTLQTGHSISALDDEDWVVFTLSEDSSVSLQTGGAVGDTFLALYDSTLTLLETDDNSATASFSLLALRLPAGTYFARVTESGGDALISNYSIRFTVGLRPGDAFEPNDIFPTATALTIDTPQEHTLSDNRAVSDVVDWFTFTLSESLDVSIVLRDAVPTIDLASQFATSTYAPPFALYDSERNLFFHATLDFAGLDGVAVNRIGAYLNAGQYYVKVFKGDFDMASTINSTYRITRSGPAVLRDAYESDNSMEEATPLEVNSLQLSHTIHTYGDSDWVRFDVVGDTSVLLDAEDPILYDSDASGFEISVFTETQTPVVSGVSPLLIDLPAGVFYARFHILDDQNLAYSYGIRLIEQTRPDHSEPDDIPENAKFIAVGDEKKIYSIHVTGDVDWVKFAAFPGLIHGIDVDAITIGLVLDVTLYQSDATTQIPIVLREPGRWETPPLDAGNYFIRISAVGKSAKESTGFYKLGARAFPGVYPQSSDDNAAASGLLPAAMAGVVSDDLSEAVEGATVTVDDVGAETESGPDGSYAVVIGPAGTYGVSASKFGYSEESDNVDIAPGGITEVDFVLANLNAPQLDVFPESRAVGFASGTTSFAVSNAGSGIQTYSAEVVSGDWLSITAGAQGGNEGTISTGYGANPNATSRTGTIRVTAISETNEPSAGSPVDVTVVQGGAPPILSVTPSAIGVGSAAGSATIAVTNDGPGTLSWTASVINGAEWLSIHSSKINGDGTITATFAENTSPSSRAGAIRVTAPGAQGSPKDITVTQGDAATPVLSLSATSVNVGAASGESTILVVNAGGGTLDWSGSVVSGSEWLSFSTSKVLGGGVILLTYPTNSTADNRSAVLRVTASGAIGSPTDISITQSGETQPVLFVHKTVHSVGSGATSVVIPIVNNGSGSLDWSAAVTSGSDWLSIVVAKVVGDGSITATIDANASPTGRSGLIRVTAPDAAGSPIDVTIHQGGVGAPVLSALTDKLFVGADPGSVDVPISNIGDGVLSWSAEVASGGDWLSVTPSSATGDGTLAVSFTENTLDTKRIGVIRVSAAGALGAPVDIAVTQGGVDNPILFPVGSNGPNQRGRLYINPISLFVGSSEGSATLPVLNIGGGQLVWSAAVTAGQSWLSITPAGATGPGALTINFQGNANAESRTGIIRIDAPDALGSPVDVAVTQGGDAIPILSVSTSVLSVGAQSGQTTLPITNAGGGSLEWAASVTSGNEWLTATASKVNGAGTLDLSYTANASQTQRTGIVQISAEGALGSPATIIIHQGGADAPVLHVSESAFIVDAGGGTRTVLVSNAGGGVLDWAANVTAGPDWLTLTTAKDGGGALTIEIASNASNSVRVGIVTVSAPDALGSPIDILVSQTGSAATPLPILSVSQTLLTVGSAEGSSSIVVSNLGGGALIWSASVIAGGDWLSAPSEEVTGPGAFSIGYDANDSSTTRSGIVRVSAAALGSPIDIVVSQGGTATPVLSVDPTELSVGSQSGIAVVHVGNAGGGELDWAATIESGDDWLDISASKIAAPGELTISYDTNATAAARTGVIRLAAASALGSPVDIIVRQAKPAAPVLDVSATSITVGPGAGSSTVSVSNAGDGTLTWSASVVSNTDWLSVAAAKVQGDGTLTISYNGNAATTTRNGLIRVEADDAIGSSVDIVVTQAGTAVPVLSVGQTLVSAGSSAGSISIPVTNLAGGTLNWSASVAPGAPWLSVSASKVSGAGFLSISYTDNAATSSRSGSIRVVADGALNSPTDIVVTQAGTTAPVLVVSQTQFTVGPGASSVDVSVSNGGNGALNWSATPAAGADWITVSAAKVLGAGTLSIGCSANAAVTPRNGIVRISAPGAIGSPVDVSITQAGASGDALPILSVGRTNVIVGAAAGNETIPVLNTGGGSLNWTATVLTGDEWVDTTISKSGDGALIVDYQANATVFVRNAIVRVSAANAVNSPVDIVVTQGGTGTPVLSVSESEIAVGATSGTRFVAVTNAGGGSLDWSAAVVSGDDWLSLVAEKVSGAGALIISHTENTIAAGRVGLIRVSAPGALNSPVDILIEQGGVSSPVLSVSATDIVVGAGAGNRTVSVSNIGGGAMTWSATALSGGSWLNLSTSGTTGDGVIILNYANNSSTTLRKALVTISAEGALGSPGLLIVTQAGVNDPVLDIAPTELVVGSGSGSTTISVVNGGSGVLDWTSSVISGSDWLSVTPNKIAGDGTATITFSANPLERLRAGYIRVQSSNAINFVVVVSVVQSFGVAPVLHVEPTLVHVGPESGSEIVNVSNLGGGALNWDAIVTSGVEWISVEASKLIGDGAITITFTQNPLALQRAGAIRVSAVDAVGSPVVIQVLQDRKPGLSATPRSVLTTAQAGQSVIAVTNSGGGVLEWTATKIAGGSWLTISSAKVNGDGEITLTYTENSVKLTRTGVVRIDAPDATGSPLTVTISQTGTLVLGDVDGDDAVTAVDVQLVVNAALDLLSFDEADIDGDGAVTAVDVQLVINAALGLS